MFVVLHGTLTYSILLSVLCSQPTLLAWFRSSVLVCTRFLGRRCHRKFPQVMTTTREKEFSVLLRAVIWVLYLITEVVIEWQVHQPWWWPIQACPWTTTTTKKIRTCLLAHGSSHVVVWSKVTIECWRCVWLLLGCRLHDGLLLFLISFVYLRPLQCPNLS